MHVAIYSLKDIIFEGEASGVGAKTIAGEITVLPHHRPLISMLASGAIHVFRPEGDLFFDAAGGFIEVEPGNSVRILVEERVASE